MGESHESHPDLDVADRAQHEGGTEHREGDAGGGAGVGRHLRGDERNACEHDAEAREPGAEQDRTGDG